MKRAFWASYLTSLICLVAFLNLSEGDPQISVVYAVPSQLILTFIGFMAWELLLNSYQRIRSICKKFRSR